MHVRPGYASHFHLAFRLAKKRRAQIFCFPVRGLTPSLPRAYPSHRSARDHREEKMTRMPHVDSARRCFVDVRIVLDAGFSRPARLARAAMAFGFGRTICCSPTFCRNAAQE